MTASVLPPVVVRHRRRPRSITGWLALRGALLLVVVTFGLPFLWTIASALDSAPARALPWPRHTTLAQFRALFDDFDAGTGLRNSLIVSLSAMVLATVSASLAGYGLSRLRARRKSWLIAGVLLMQTIPLAVTMVPLYDLAIRLHLQDGYPGLILTHATISLPLLVWLMKGFTDTVPRDIEDAARLDGASAFRGWFDIILPATVPGLAVVAGFAFASAWSEVLMVVLLVNDPSRATLPFLFYQVASDGRDANLIAALGVLYILPVVVVFLVLRRLMVRSLQHSTNDL